MKVSVYIQIQGRIDSKKLYAAIEQYGINVTDMGDTSLVYGECDIEEAARVVGVCAQYGDMTAEVKR